MTHTNELPHDADGANLPTDTDTVQADPLKSFGIFSRPARPDRRYLRVEGHVTGVHHFSVGLRGLAAMAADLQAAVAAMAAAQPEENSLSDGDLMRANEIIGDLFENSNVPLHALGVAFTARLARAVEEEAGAHAVEAFFEQMIAAVRTFPPETRIKN